MGSVEGTPPRTWLRRLGWFILLWFAGVGAVGAVAYILRLWIA
ncbi:DUF2474 family protein [Paracoccus aurantiacus]|uniref:DUF2474 family protein n=1 Tax=Paracoccus aurantiacus TaxID=2599412 RepID=A0A5C6RRI6_9RHOB|nr:DUF2474 family protein [Paracoccus aurantiacus]